MDTLEIPTRDDNGYPRQIMLTTAFTQLKEAGLDDIAEVMQQMHRAYQAASKRIAELEKAATLFEWVDGIPPHPWNTEWFIAKTIHGDRVGLRALPEEYSYDFTTADGTYMKAANIKQWMQLPDSEFIPPPSKRIAELEKELEQCRPKWKVCPECMGRGQRDIAHGVTEDCGRCEGKGVIAAKAKPNAA